MIVFREPLMVVGVGSFAEGHLVEPHGSGGRPHASLRDCSGCRRGHAGR